MGLLKRLRGRLLTHAGDHAPHSRPAASTGVRTQGWEDLNNHVALRTDVVYQTAAGRDEELASAPTRCRMEKLGDCRSTIKLYEVLVEQFIASFKTLPRELVLDVDATDSPLHGKQEGRFFHGYYDSYCYLPLYVFCREQMLAAYLRPSKLDGAKHAAAILKLLVTRLRQAWPDVCQRPYDDTIVMRHIPRPLGTLGAQGLPASMITDT